MRSRLESLKRLVSLYGSVEAMHSTELQRRTAAVREAEQAIVAQQGALRQSASYSRDGLNDGDRVGWKAAQVQREIAEWKQERLEQVRMERERSSEEARKRYIASRLRSEQIRHLTDRAEAGASIDAGRRAQAGLDDRFLSRKRWTDARERSQAAAEMKAS
jgi:hypothetical protein